MPGQQVLEHHAQAGRHPSDNEFFLLAETVKLNKVERRDLIISLLNENHEPVMTWIGPQRVSGEVRGSATKASGNEVAIESIEVAHEGLEVQND